MRVPASKEELDKAIESIVVSRIGLIMNNPFWGNIATRLQIVNGEEWCDTAATDGRYFYINPKFVNKLRPKEITFLIGHELLHALYDHVGEFSRVNGRHAKLFFIAGDYAINRDLIEYHIGERITTVPILYDKKYDGMITEEIYEHLLKNATQIDQEKLEKMLLDDHLDGNGDGEGEDNKNGSGRPTFTAEELQQIKDELKEAMLSAAQAVGIGSLPGGIRRLLKELTEPEMDWRQILQQQIESQIKNDFTYLRPSRRGWSSDAILPSMKKEPSVEALVALDLSGSIGEKEISKFMSELIGIMQQHQSFKIDVMCFDVAVHNHQTFTEDNFEDVHDYELTGGGGTNFSCVGEYIKDHDLSPKQIVFLTDGETYHWSDPDIAPTLFIIKNNHNKGIVAPYGTTVYFSD